MIVLCNFKKLTEKKRIDFELISVQIHKEYTDVSALFRLKVDKVVRFCVFECRKHGFKFLVREVGLNLK